MESSVVVVSPKPVQMELQYRSSPFQMELKETSKDYPQTLDKGVLVVVSAQKPYWFAYFWGCDIPSFHEAVALNWIDLRTNLKEGKLFEGKALESSTAEICFETEREVVIKSKKKLTVNDLGPSPRSRFPLVLVMVVHGDDSGEEQPLKATDVVALVCAVHVKDSLCTSESTFVFKLSKLLNGQVLNVTKLFARDDSEQDAAICLVCEAERVTIGLLPCRHFSLCESCFERLPTPKQCPVCRSYVTRFFQHLPNLNAVPGPVESTERHEQHEQHEGETPEEIDEAPAPSNGVFRRIRRYFS